MPNVDGLTATREIRSGLDLDAQPAIFGLTAHAMLEYRDICLRAGMNGCLTKPVQMEQLRSLITDCPRSRPPTGAKVPLTSQEPRP